MSNNRDHLVGWNWNQFFAMFLYFETSHPSQVPGDEEVTDVECEDPANPGKLGPCTRETPYKLSMILFKRNKPYLLFSLHHLPKQALCVNLRLIHIWLLLVQVLILMIAAPSSGPFRLVEVFCSLSNQDFMGTLGLGLLLTGSPPHTIWRGLSPILRL